VDCTLIQVLVKPNTTAQLSAKFWRLWLYLRRRKGTWRGYVYGTISFTR